MPYKNELAPYRTISRIASSANVQDALGGFRVRADNSQNARAALALVPVPPRSWTPQWLVSIDGSRRLVVVRQGFPVAEACYLSVATVLTNVRRVRALSAQRPFDPRLLREAYQSTPLDYVLPSCNVLCGDASDTRTSFRQQLAAMVASQRLNSEGESLADTLRALIAHSGQAQFPCGNAGCTRRIDTRAFDETTCPCAARRPLYLTDVLQLHDNISDVPASNIGVFTETMHVVERLWLMHVLRTTERKSASGPQRLSQLGFVVDGPLAVMGNASWLAGAMRTELARINAQVRDVCGEDLVLVGIEKEGTTAQFFAMLDQAGGFPAGHAAVLSDAYVKQFITFSQNNAGANTYFGRKVLFKTTSGARAVVSLPFLRDEHACPRLFDTLSLLDQSVSTRYPHAFAPIVAANAQAAIPATRGGAVLERLARTLMGA